MTSRIRIFLIGIVAVVVFDALAAIASRVTGIPYFWASFASWVLYIGIGYVAGRVALQHPIRVAAITGLVSGLADASLGWAASWTIGPGRVAGGITAIQWLLTAAIVSALATGFAALGGDLSRRFRRRV